MKVRRMVRRVRKIAGRVRKDLTPRKIAKGAKSFGRSTKRQLKSSVVRRKRAVQSISRRNARLRRKTGRKIDNFRNKYLKRRGR